jgi:hypothetical protein
MKLARSYILAPLEKRARARAVAPVPQIIGRRKHGSSWALVGRRKGEDAIPRGPISPPSCPASVRPGVRVGAARRLGAISRGRSLGTVADCRFGHAWRETSWIVAWPLVRLSRLHTARG